MEPWLSAANTDYMVYDQSMVTRAWALERAFVLISNRFKVLVTHTRLDGQRLVLCILNQLVPLLSTRAFTTRRIGLRILKRD